MFHFGLSKPPRFTCLLVYIVPFSDPVALTMDTMTVLWDEMSTRAFLYNSPGVDEDKVGKASLHFDCFPNHLTLSITSPLPPVPTHSGVAQFCHG